MSGGNNDELFRKYKVLIKQRVMDKLSERDELSEEEILEVIDNCITETSREYTIPVGMRIDLRTQLFHSIKRLDVLQDYLDDETVTEIMVNGVDNIFIERDGRLILTGARFDSKERLMDIVQQIAADANRTVNMSSPILDARLKDGSRVNIVLDPIALDGPILTIRRFPKDPINAETLIRYGSVSRDCMELLKKLVISGYNIMISGGTGSGKTTFLNVLSGFIPRDARIITIEDSAELKIQGIDNLVRMETRNANVSGCMEITIRDLIKTALRMRPDRIVVGEVRGEEAIDMLQAFNVGQDGSLSTIHANSAADALYRLETMIMLNSEIPLTALRRQIASGVDIIIHLNRLRDGSRHLSEIREVTGIDGGEITTRLMYEFEEMAEVNGRITGEYIKRNGIFSDEKLKRAGYLSEI